MDWIRENTGLANTGQFTGQPNPPGTFDGFSHKPPPVPFTKPYHNYHTKPPVNFLLIKNNIFKTVFITFLAIFNID